MTPRTLINAVASVLWLSVGFVTAIEAFDGDGVAPWLSMIACFCYSASCASDVLDAIDAISHHE